MSEHKLSLPAAILINFNVMLGTGIFINTVPLARLAGFTGGLSYVIVGILMAPLIACIMQLLFYHPSGGFYIFGAREINPFAGFLSAWCYFISKLASSMLTIHVAVGFLQQIFPPLASIHCFAADCFVVFCFVLLNTANIRIGSIIQTIFVIFKALPIIGVMISGLVLFSLSNIQTNNSMIHSVPLTIPLVLYAMIGFEAACSLSRRIENARRNAPIAILISSLLVILITTLFQSILYGSLGSYLLRLCSYQDVFPALMHTLLPNAIPLSALLITLFHVAIASSALGGAYGVLFSNMWNLYALAEHKHTYMPSWITQLNRHHIPWICVIIEGIICVAYLIVTSGSAIPLQQVSAFGSVIAYTMSIIALYQITTKPEQAYSARILPVLGLISCAILASTCIYGFIRNGAHAFLIFITFVFFGIYMFWQTSHTFNESTNFERNERK